MKKRSTIFVGIIMAVAVIAGIMFLPNYAKAETVNGDNGIIYVKDSVKYNFKTYWDAKKAPVKEPRKGMKKRLIMLAIFAWIILSALCYLLTPPLVLGIVIFALVYNIFKRLKI